MNENNYNSQLTEIRNIMRVQFICISLAIILGIIVLGFITNNWLEILKIGGSLTCLIIFTGPLIYSRAKQRVNFLSRISQGD